jgi:hypothetical protein
MESSGAAVILFFVVISITAFCYACARRNHGEGIDAGETIKKRRMRTNARSRSLSMVVVEVVMAMAVVVTVVVIKSKRIAISSLHITSTIFVIIFVKLVIIHTDHSKLLHCYISFSCCS